MTCHLWTRLFVKVLKIFLAITLSVSVLTGCQKKSGPSASVGGGGGGGGGGNTSEGEIDYEVSGTIAEEEPVEFVQSMDSVEISGVNLASSTQYQIKAFYLSPSGKKVLIHESVSNSNRFDFKAKVPKHLIIIEAVRIGDGGKFAGLLPPPMRKTLAKLRMNRTTSIAAKMASIIADKASSGDSAAQSALTSNSVSVADVVTVAQSVRLVVDTQKTENVGIPIDLTRLASILVEKSNDRFSALTYEGQNPEVLAAKLSEKTYATVFGDKSDEISPAILAHRTNHDLGSSVAARRDVAYETIKSLQSPSSKQLDEAFRVEADAYRKAADLAGAVTAESTVSSVYTPKFTACSNGSSSCAATAYVPPPPPVLLLGGVSAPIATPQAGIYTSGQAVTLSTSTPGARIYYTVDGSTPTTASTLYSNPIAILVDQTIKAIAVKDGYSTSSESSNVYSITGTVATPTFSITQGSYGPAQSVTISSTTPGATIYYTTNNTAPTTGSSQYSGAITVSTSQTIRAIAVLANWSNSAEASAAYTINGAVAAPAFSIPEGSYGPAQTVSITTTTPGAVIYYTTNGTDPTASSDVYSSAVTVSSTTTIKAMAVMIGYSNSTISSATYTINGSVSTPTTNVPVGDYGPTQSVTLSSATSEASIRYNIGDGTQADPTCSSGSTSMPISVTATSSIKAIACKMGYSDSTVALFAYTINGAVAAPAFSIPEGSYGPAQTVSITTTTPGAVIYYTTNGTDPTASSDVYSSAVTVSSTTTIKAMAVMLGYSNSTISSATYTINGAVATPTFSVPAGAYGPAQSVTLSTTTPGATIYYTTNNTAPTTGSSQYSGAITVSTSQTIRAIAVLANWSNSAEASAAYTINGAVSTPTASPIAGAYTSAQTVTLSTTTSDARIYYTLDGSDPTTSSTEYSSAITVSKSTTIKAIAVKAGFSGSTTTEFAYTLNIPIYKHSFTKSIPGNSTVQSLTVTNPSEKLIESGDTLVVAVMSRSDITSISPGSWTTLGSTTGVQRSTYRQRITIAYKTATGNPAIDNQVTVSQASTARMIASVMVFKGAVLPTDLQAGANASWCSSAAMPAVDSVLSDEMIVYGYSLVMTPTWDYVEQQVAANFYDVNGAEDSRLTKDVAEIYNRFTLALGQVGINHSVTTASTSLCYSHMDDLSMAAEALRFKVKKLTQ